MKTKIISVIVFIILLLGVFVGCTANKTGEYNSSLASKTSSVTVEKDGTYNSKDEVALYIHTYNKLPNNYITKSKAEKLGWKSSQGNLWDVARGKSIGGSHFSNYDEQLPKENGRKYYECDIEYAGGYRGAERLIYSNDGLVFYTNDHYKSFTQLY